VKYNTNAEMLHISPRLGVEKILSVGFKDDGSVEIAIDVPGLPSSRFIRMVREDGRYWIIEEIGL
jgi:hypothetical protein